jgi:hypothetical protein
MLLTILAVAISAIVGVFAWNMYLVWRAKDRTWGHLDEAGVHRGLSMFLKRGYDGSVAVLTDRSTGLFIQFRKYIHEPGQYGIESHFPRAPWSQRYYQGIQDVLKLRGVAFERVAAADGDPTVEFIHVDFGHDIDSATAIVAQIVVEVFLLPKVEMRLRAEEICVKDVLVDRKDFPRVSDIVRGARVT